MERMLEITYLLQQNKETLAERVAVLNLPTANFCKKRAELVRNSAGALEQACYGCITQQIPRGERMSLPQIKEIIDYFAREHQTMFITINGRGDPFHPALAHETREKIRYAAERWDIQAYVFTAGSHLTTDLCSFLAESNTNVMISLYGNRFIDANFFRGKQYSSAQKPLQNEAEIAYNLRRLIETYTEGTLFAQTEGNTTRLGMNYVVSEDDLRDKQKKLAELKRAANAAGLFFICNTPFTAHSRPEIQQQLEHVANQYSNFHLRHSTAVEGQCQMGAGSAVTVDYDGTLLRCPYMHTSHGNGKFFELSREERKSIIQEYYEDRKFPCVMRTHQE